MVALNFSPEFAPDVEAGRKLQTIRQSIRVKPGQALQLYTGQRTKACRKLGDAICTEVGEVTLTEQRVWRDGEYLTAEQQFVFAKWDGFPDYATMWAWFRSRYGNRFDGFVIRWKLSPPLPLTNPPPGRIQAVGRAAPSGEAIHDPQVHPGLHLRRHQRGDRGLRRRAHRCEPRS